MKALLIVFTFTVLLLYTGSSTIAEIVTISAQLPGVGASYVHCWAAAGSAANKHVPFPCQPGTNKCGNTNTAGANITCDAQKTHAAGDSASAHANAKVTGGIAVDARVPAAAGPSMNKVTFSAAAAYAQGGGQVRKDGENKSSLAFVEIDKLKVTGRQDPVDDEVDIVVSDLKPEEVNYALIKKVVKDRDLLDQILEQFTQSGFEPSAQSKSYLQVRAKITAEKEFVAEVSAPLLCDIGKLRDRGIDVHNLSSQSPQVAEAVRNVLANVKEFCFKRNNVDQTSSFEVNSKTDANGLQVHVANQTKKLEYVIVIPENTPKNLDGNNFSVNTIQSTSSRKEPGKTSSQGQQTDRRNDIAAALLHEE